MENIQSTYIEGITGRGEKKKKKKKSCETILIHSVRNTDRKINAIKKNSVVIMSSLDKVFQALQHLYNDINKGTPFC